MIVDVGVVCWSSVGGQRLSLLRDRYDILRILVSNGTGRAVPEAFALLGHSARLCRRIPQMSSPTLHTQCVRSTHSAPVDRGLCAVKTQSSMNWLPLVTPRSISDRIIIGG